LECEIIIIIIVIIVVVVVVVIKSMGLDIRETFITRIATEEFTQFLWSWRVYYRDCKSLSLPRQFSPPSALYV
jgi:hypothetical protein